MVFHSQPDRHTLTLTLTHLCHPFTSTSFLHLHPRPCITPCLRPLPQFSPSAELSALDVTKSSVTNSTRRASGPRLSTSLEQRDGTLLVCKLDLEQYAVAHVVKPSEAFLQIVEEAALATHGVVHAFSPGSVTVSWNLFCYHPLHQALASTCALRVQEREPASHLVLVSSVFKAGIIGTDRTKAPVIEGPGFEVSVADPSSGRSCCDLPETCTTTQPTPVRSPSPSPSPLPSPSPSPSPPLSRSPSHSPHPHPPALIRTLTLTLPLRLITPPP